MHILLQHSLWWIMVWYQLLPKSSKRLYCEDLKSWKSVRSGKIVILTHGAAESAVESHSQDVRTSGIRDVFKWVKMNKMCVVLCPAYIRAVCHGKRVGVSLSVSMGLLLSQYSHTLWSGREKAKRNICCCTWDVADSIKMAPMALTHPDTLVLQWDSVCCHTTKTAGQQPKEQDKEHKASTWPQIYI